MEDSKKKLLNDNKLQFLILYKMNVSFLECFYLQSFLFTNLLNSLLPN